MYNEGVVHMGKKDKQVKPVGREPKFIKPYYYSKKTKVFLCIIMFVSAVCFILLDFVNLDGKSDLFGYFISFVKQLTLLITSIIGTEFLLSLALEKRNQNDAFKEFFKEDFINSSIFTEMVPQDKQKIISDKYRLEKIFDNKKVVSEMIDYAQEKLCENLGDFYYEDCSYHVNCSIDKGMFKKSVKKVIQIRSIKGSIEKKKFPLLSVYTEKSSNNVASVEVPVLRMKKANESRYKTLVEGKDYYCEYGEVEETLKKKNGYDCKITYILRDKVELFEDKDLCIEVNCVKYSKLDDDLTSVFRVQVPCRKFEINFHAPESYQVKPNAFGYIDHSQKAVNGEEPENVKIRFDKWIFPDDGAIIEVQKITKKY